MSVAVDEPGHNHAAGGVDFHGSARLRQILDAASGSNLLQNAVADE